jgi:uncharacterized protein (TIGR02996 family)
MPSAEEKGFLSAIKKNPKDATARGAYADWLDEQNRPYEAVLQRGKAGLSEVYFKIRRKSDGKFSAGAKWPAITWSERGKMWARLTDVHSHFRGLGDTRNYGGVPWDDIEVVIFEMRITYTAALPLKREKVKGQSRLCTTAVEPLGAADAPAAE